MDMRDPQNRAMIFRERFDFLIFWLFLTSTVIPTLLSDILGYRWSIFPRVGKKLSRYPAYLMENKFPDLLLPANSIDGHFTLDKGRTGLPSRKKVRFGDDERKTSDCNDLDDSKDVCCIRSAFE